MSSPVLSYTQTSVSSRTRSILINVLEKGALPTCNAAIAILIFVQVVARYLFNSPPSWTEELARIFMIWLGFLGISVTATRNQEVKLQGILSLFGSKARKWLVVLRDECLIIFIGVLFYHSIWLPIEDRYTLTGALEISWAWIYSALAVGLFFYIVLALPPLFIRLLKAGKPAIIILIILCTFYVGMRAGLFTALGVPLTLLTPIVLLFLMFIEMPVGLALGAAGFYFILAQGQLPLILMPNSITRGVDSFTLMALPLFIFAAELMNRGGITEKMIQFTLTIVGHLKGGLGHVAVGTNMIMAGVSGSALADTAATGSILIPEMEKKGYDKHFASAIIVASGAIGPIIPPSIFFIIYGGLGNVSVYKLFMAGAVPGILMGLFIMIVVYIMARRRGYPTQARASFGEILSSFVKALPALFMPVAIIGGMVAGMFTPTEAGAIAVFYALILGITYRKLNLRSIWQSLSRTAGTIGTILIIVAAAHLISYIANWTKVPHLITELLLSLSDSPSMALLIINIFLLVLGCFEAVMPILIITTPILVPALVKLGVDPVHFGVVMTLNLLIGMMTPPFGASLFLVVSLAKLNMKDLLLEMRPFFLALLILLALVTYVPNLSLFLPQALK